MFAKMKHACDLVQFRSVLLCDPGSQGYICASRYIRAMVAKPLITLCVALLLNCVAALGQTSWQSTYGGYSTDEANSVLVNANGEYLVVGSTGSFGAGNGDIYVLLLDTTGAKLWSTTLGGVGVEQGRKALQTADGGYVIAGITNSFGNGGYDGYVAKINDLGELVWEHSYGGSGWDFFYSISSSPDGGFIAAGQTFSSGNGGGDAWVVKLDASGNSQWERTYGGDGDDLARCIIGTTDGGYMIAGGFSAATSQNAWLVKLDHAGEDVWAVQVGGDSLDYANSVIQTADGGYVAVGFTRSYSSSPEALQFKLDSTGDEQWVQHWLQGSGEEYYDQIELANGRLVAVGSVDGLGSGGKDIYILFTESNGVFISGVTNGGDQGDGDESASAIARTIDGGFVLCGYSESFGYGVRDVYVVKTDSVGLTVSTEVQSYFDPLATLEISNGDQAMVWPTLISTGEVMKIRRSTPGAFSTARITDMRGTILAVIPISSGAEAAFRVPDLAPGPYLITVLQNGEIPITAKFLIVN